MSFALGASLFFSGFIVGMLYCMIVATYYHREDK